MLQVLAMLPNILPIISKFAISIGPFLKDFAPKLFEIGGKYLPKIIDSVESDNDKDV